MRSWVSDCSISWHIALVVMIAWVGTDIGSSSASERFRAIGEPSRSPRPATEAELAPSILDCSGATDLSIGTTAFGATTGATNNVSAYGCSPWVESGGEAVFRIVIAEAMRIEITLIADCDLDIILLDGCDPVANCLIAADTGIRSNGPVSGEFFVVVDGYEGASCGFQLLVANYFPLPANPVLCSGALPVTCSFAGGLQGDTCGQGDTIRNLECSYSVADGQDAAYLLSVQPSGFVDATLSMPTADGVLWLLKDCGLSTECIGYADAGFDGEDERLRYDNVTGIVQNIYLVVDSFGQGSCAEFSVDLECSGTSVATQRATWSELKGLFSGAPTTERVGAQDE